MPTRGHGVGPGGGGYCVWSNWEKLWRLFRPLKAIRRSVRRNRPTVTLDREAQGFSLMGRVPNISLILSRKLQMLTEREREKGGKTNINKDRKKKMW